MSRIPYKFDSICEITSSKRVFAGDYLPSGIPFFRGKEITEKYKGALIVSTELFISENKYNEIKSRHGVPLEGDLLLTSVGTLGSTYIVKTGDKFYFKDGNITWFRNFRHVDSKYIRYWMQSPTGVGELKKSEIGSSQSAYTIANLKMMDIEVPDKEEQESVVEVLEKYDDLIENNNRRIAILEETAQLLYREWFVKFRYPGHESQKLVESPLGLIPEGWKVDRLINLTSKIGSGATPRGGDSAYKNEGIPLIRSLNIYDGKFINRNLAYIDDEQAAKLKNVTVQVGDVLLNITGASVARCAIVPASLTPARVNQHVSIIRANSNEISAEYILYTLISENGKSRLLSIAQGGATREAITKSHIENFQLIIPDGELLKQFSRIALSITKQKEKLFFSIENLKEQRDMLLPKLISGQISLNMEGS